ncbi:MAG: class I SAM-dependent methyltransferase [Planctomycetia bacterium]
MTMTTATDLDGYPQGNRGHLSPRQDSLLMSGDVFVLHRFYRHLIPLLKGSTRVLNLGSGIAFAFEQSVHSLNPCIEMWSIDRLEPQRVPKGVTRFIKADIEKDLPSSDWGVFDVVCAFEVIEHVDMTDAVIRNAAKLCRPNGSVVISFPNLASAYGRLELLMGLQPHVVEVSNERANFGSGWFGRYNNPTDVPIHHIRGITTRAGRELLTYHGLSIRQLIGTSHGRFEWLWRLIPGIAPVNVVVAQKL